MIFGKVFGTFLGAFFGGFEDVFGKVPRRFLQKKEYKRPI